MSNLSSEYSTFEKNNWNSDLGDNGFTIVRFTAGSRKNLFKTTLSALFRIAKISLDNMLVIIHEHTNLSH